MTFKELFERAKAMNDAGKPYNDVLRFLRDHGAFDGGYSELDIPNGHRLTQIRSGDIIEIDREGLRYIPSHRS